MINRTTIEICQSPPIEVQVGTIGLQGPKGDKGDPGNVGDSATAVFAGQTMVTIDHNRGYRPIVSITDTDGQELDTAIDHTSFNSFTVGFNVPQSGRITYF